MLLVRNLILHPDDEESRLRELIAERLGGESFTYRIIRRSVDARRPRRGAPSSEREIQINYQCVVDFSSAGLSDVSDFEDKMSRRQDVEIYKDKLYQIKRGTYKRSEKERPIVVGFGPAGLLAAYLLAKEGLRPILLERGESIDERAQTVDAFWSGQAPLNPESNVQFGEGGAGAFSDGKLTSRSKDSRQNEVLRILVENGANPEILYQTKAHIGTDALRPIVKRMRERLCAWGGEVHFNTRMEALELAADGSIQGLHSSAGPFSCSELVLAIGHSARDTFRMLLKQGVAAEAKAFAVGLRVEHPQSFINEAQYGDWAGHPALGAASYHLTSQQGERGVFTFCMCPGGLVVAAASEEGRLVVNGMSYQARGLENANSAVLVTVRPGLDYSASDLEAGLRFQEDLEKKAYVLGGGGFTAPVTTMAHFLGQSDELSLGLVKPSYRPGYRLCDLRSFFSPEMTEALRAGLAEMDRKLSGFAAPYALLTAVESRSSSPLRFLRSRESLESVSTPGLYPCGEGAGYAGGIISSAIDGLRVAERILARDA